MEDVLKDIQEFFRERSILKEINSTFLVLISIIMVHEVIHSMEAGKRDGMLLKLDLSKAYDRVNWSFLGLVL